MSDSPPPSFFNQDFWELSVFDVENDVWKKEEESKSKPVNSPEKVANEKIPPSESFQKSTKTHAHLQKPAIAVKCLVHRRFLGQYSTFSVPLCVHCVSQLEMQESL